MSESTKAIEAVKSSGEITETSLETTALTVSREQLAEIHKRAESLSKMEAGISLNPRYYEFENKGDSVRGVFLGFKELVMNDRVNGGTKTSRAVMWMDEQKSVYVNAGVSLVSVFTEVNVPQFAAVQIEFSGTEKTKSGNTVKVYDVRLMQ